MDATRRKRPEYVVLWHVNGADLTVVRFLTGERKGEPRTWNNRHTALADSERSCYGIPAEATINIQPRGYLVA